MREKGKEGYGKLVKKQFKNIWKINLIIGKNKMMGRGKKNRLNKKEWYRLSRKIKQSKQKWNR